MPFLEEIETISVVGVVEEVRDFERKVRDGGEGETEPACDVRILDPKTPKYYRLTISHAEIVEQGLVPEQIVEGLACRVLGERVTMNQGARAGQQFISVKKVQFGKPGERLRVAGQEAVSAEVAKVNGKGKREPVGAGSAQDTPF